MQTTKFTSPMISYNIYRTGVSGTILKSLFAVNLIPEMSGATGPHYIQIHVITRCAIKELHCSQLSKGFMI